MRENPMKIIADLTKAESKCMFDAGRRGGTGRDRIRETHKMRTGSQELRQLPLTGVVNGRQDVRFAANLNDRRKDVTKDNPS